MSNEKKTGELIKEARLRAGMTQAQLAAILHIPYQSIGQWERGIRKPKAETIRAIADALNVDPYSLTSWDDSTKLVKQYSDASDLIKKPPAETGERQVTDDEIKFALFGTTDIDDDVFEDVKALARTAAEQAAKRKRKKEE